MSYKSGKGGERREGRFARACGHNAYKHTTRGEDEAKGLGGG